MDRPLADKVAIVTGAPEGIGAATARRLSQLGCAVMIHYNSRPAPAEALAAELQAAGGKAAIVQANLLDADASERIVAATTAAFGPRIDIVVNNAGINGRALLAEHTPQFVHDHFQINTFAVLYLIQAAVPFFPAEGGAIVNVSTNLVLNPAVSTTVYSASKAAVDSMTLCLAKELAGRKITVNAVQPGATLTPMSSAMNDEMKAAVGRRTPLGRIGMPDDIAGAICFFALPEGRWATGQTLLVDGGFTQGAFGWTPPPAA